MADNASVSKNVSDNPASLVSLGSRESEKQEPRYKNIVHLWEFLLELLAYGDECRLMIAWVREEHGEFKLENPEEVAKIWGEFKNFKGMNYEKLSRALRQYYQKGIIKKVPRKKLVYKFNKLPYKYKPGVTRALLHGRRIHECIQQHLMRGHFAPCSTNSGSFSSPLYPVSTPTRKRWSWPLQPMPSRPVVPCPGYVPHPPPASYSKTRIMFPFAVDPVMRLPSSVGFSPFTSNLSPENYVLQHSNPYVYRQCCHIC